MLEHYPGIISIVSEALYRAIVEYIQWYDVESRLSNDP